MLAVTWVQMMKPMTKAPVNGAIRRARAGIARASSPVVFRDKNVAPCSAQTRTKVTPVHTP